MRIITRGNWAAGSLLMALFAVVFVASTALATTSTSPNYEASEAEFGAGAALETCSGQYCAQATIGRVGGDSSSSNYTASFSTLADDDTEPLLELMVEPGESNLGKLDTDRTATRTMRLNVRSHHAGGYIVQVLGEPPSYEGYTMASPIEPISSLQGTEQFALNAVANTSPAVGASPEAIAGGADVRNVVLPKYGSANMFAYTSGDTIAKSMSDSSQVRYTISMIINVSGNTPAGHFSSDFTAVVTPVF